MPRLILFDIGHVLVELTGSSLIKRFAQTDLTDEYIQATWITVPGVRRFETGVCDQEEFADSVIAFYNLSCSASQFADSFRNAAERKFEGVDEFLAGLCERHELACLTNTNPLQWPRICDEFGLGEYFSRQYVSFQLGLMKPDIAIYDHVLEDTSLAPNDILFIDDNLNNCTAARSRGIETCHVSSFADVQSQVTEKLGA